MKTITLLLNFDIDVNGKVYKKEGEGYYKYYSMFVKKGVALKIGAVIELKPLGRPKGTSKVYRTVYIEKTALNQMLDVVKVLNKDQRILDKINEGQEKDVALYTWDTLPPALNEFWSKYFNK